jgi:hypothetical protein
VPLIVQVEGLRVAHPGSGVVLGLIIQPDIVAPRETSFVGAIENAVPIDVVIPAGIVRIGGLAETDKVTTASCENPRVLPARIVNVVVAIVEVGVPEIIHVAVTSFAHEGSVGVPVFVVHEVTVSPPALNVLGATYMGTPNEPWVPLDVAYESVGPEVLKF